MKLVFSLHFILLGAIKSCVLILMDRYHANDDGLQTAAYVVEKKYIRGLKQTSTYL